MEATDPTPMNFFQRWMQNPRFCRSYFLTTSVLEVSDMGSDILWFLAVVSSTAFQSDDDGNQNYGGVGAIAGLTTFFFLMASLLLLSKFTEDFRALNAVGDQNKPYKKMEIFGFSIGFLLTMTDEEVLLLYAQLKADRDAEKCHVIDGIVGINRSDNYLDMEVPWLSRMLLPSLWSEGTIPVKLWEVICYPLSMTWSATYVRTLCIFHFLFWPISFFSVFTICSIVCLGVVNLLAKSDHWYTIRLFEDIPQLCITIAYLCSPYGRDGINLASVLSLSMSALMLTKFVCEIIFKALTSSHKCQLIHRRLQLPSSPSALHVIFVTIITPFMIYVATAGFTAYILVEAGLGGFLMTSTRVVYGWWGSRGKDTQDKDKLADSEGGFRL